MSFQIVLLKKAGSCQDAENAIQVRDASTQYCPISSNRRSIGTQTLKPRLKRKRNEVDRKFIEHVQSEGSSNNTNPLVDHNYSTVVPSSCILPDTPLEETNKNHTTIQLDEANELKDPENDNEEQNDSSTSEDNYSDDELYTYHSSEESSDESVAEISYPTKNEKTFIVFESKLDELFKFCQECKSPVCEVTKTTNGSMVTIHTLCLQNHEYTWQSQPTTSNHIPAGNVLIPAAIVCTGGTYQDFSNFADALNLNFVGKSSFYQTQNKIVLPIINKQYKQKQKNVINDIKGEMPVDLCGDGRSDSPGHTAKYGSYSLMHERSGRIVDFSLVHVSEVSSSNAMEYEGCKRSLNNLLKRKISIRCLTTDRHTQVTSQLQKNYPSIIHQYDVWHLAKWVTKKLTKKAKTKANMELQPWIKSVSNHLWWSAKECNNDPDLLVKNWVSIVNHVANKHSWKEGKATVKCKHPKLSRQERKEVAWLKPGSSAHVALEEIVYNKKLLKDIRMMTEYHHTGNLEVFHSLLLKYAPKRKHFSYQGMIGRTQLAIMDHNANCDRPQATTTKGDNKGETRYKVVFPKNRKTWVAKPILEKKSFTFVKELIDEVRECKSKLQRQKTPAKIPKNIATVPRPPKEEVIKMHISRIVKKKHKQ